jgi:copper(I)-binding protein
MMRIDFDSFTRRAMLFAMLLPALWLPLAYAADDVAVKNAWARATAPGQRTASVYLDITSRFEATIVSVSSPDAKSAEIHESRTEGGIMKMRRLDRLALPAKTSVSLAPGGLHVMLIDIARPLQPNNKVYVEFTIETAGGKRSTVAVQAEVRAGAAPQHVH